jgi:hypothetical protein
MGSLKKEIAETEVLIGYLEFMAALIPGFDYRQMIDTGTRNRFFFQNDTRYDVAQRLPEIKALLTKQSHTLAREYPLKKTFEQVVTAYHDLKQKEDVLNSGVTYGFLNELMDLSKFRWYADMPYHYRIAIGPNKGNGGIEEEFLLKDAFVLYQKAENHYGQVLKLHEELKKKGKDMDKQTYQQVTDLKYEIANYSRMSVLGFYSFIECFVNSIGFNHLYSYEQHLTEPEKIALKGLKKNNGYMNLKNRIESLQTIIRQDHLAVLNVTDDKQRVEPFSSFFDDFEHLRNASVHYSPIKQRIWMGPQEWIEKSRKFCDVALQTGLEIWKSCYPNSDGPLYMGKLDKNKQLELASQRINTIGKLGHEQP